MEYSIRNVRDTETMLKYCNFHLCWNIDEEYFDDIDELTYDFSASDLGIKEEEFAKVSSFKEMRPLEERQDWGVFIVEFEGKNLEVTVLRKILGALVPKRTNRDRHTWNCNNIFFMCLWGERTVRTIGFSAFEDDMHRLPILSMVYCTPSIESRQQLDTFEQRISFLECKHNERFIDRLQYWHGALQPRGQVIRNSQYLTEKLAESAIKVKGNLLSAYNVETENGVVHNLYQRFNHALNIDLSEHDFMSMYAQTLVYGLFSARCMQQDSARFTAESAVESIPPTNPLLKELLKECCIPNGSMPFDELDVSDIIDILDNINLKEILSDFNRQTGYGKEDPVAYFYESFLNLFEKEQKKRCGVYYTPAAVANFMVDSVAEILKDKLGYDEGFYSTGISILDPAVGTGTFLRKILFEIYKEFKRKYEGPSENVNAAWSDYASANVLPRLAGFEFMMAPYSVAHMKIALALQDTGYLFPAGTRLNVLLANTLNQGLINSGCEDVLELETKTAQQIKNHGINVIIGNPPYHADSKNQNAWIMSLMEDYKKEPDSTEKLNERNPKLVNDDYVKFTRFAQEISSSQENAVTAFVMPFSYASNLTFRGMRWSLLKNYSEIYILNMHGNVMGRDSTDSEHDENIFDIQLGVCITFLIKKKCAQNELAKVYYADLIGTREEKYRFLLHNSLNSITWQEVNPVKPYFFLKPVDMSNSDEYQLGVNVSELFPKQLGGIKTHDDEHLVSLRPFTTGYDQLYDYRPFDIRHINYDRSKVERDRFDVMQHMIGHHNLGLVIDRQVVTDNWSHVQIVKNMIDNRLHYSNRGIPVLCPMYLYDGDDAQPNINRALLPGFEEATGLEFSEELTDAEDKFDVLNLFDYVYAILNSHKYINKYEEFLKIEFPRVPLPTSLDAFRDLCEKGEILRKLHLSHSSIDNHLNIEFVGDGDRTVSRRKLVRTNLYINASQYFTNISNELWDFCFGGYHGLQKWFKDRNGTRLSEDDIGHVISVFNIFDCTMDIKKDIDEIMTYYGIVE